MVLHPGWGSGLVNEGFLQGASHGSDRDQGRAQLVPRSADTVGACLKDVVLKPIFAYCYLTFCFSTFPEG